MLTVSDIPLPPVDFMQLVCGYREGEELVRTFHNAGQNQVKRFADLGLVNSSLHMLDVGCGCGRFARALIPTPIRSYVGFDRHAGLVNWARENITPRDSRFTFYHFDVSSPYDTIDGIVGVIPAEHFQFPFVDGQFNAANLASVFTHMHLVEIQNYLRELHRVVETGGTMIFSVFLTQRPGYAVKHNVFLTLPDFKSAVEKAGWKFTPADQKRVDSGSLLYDNNQQNFFTAVRQ